MHSGQRPFILCLLRQSRCASMWPTRMRTRSYGRRCYIPTGPKRTPCRRCVCVRASSLQRAILHRVQGTMSGGVSKKETSIAVRFAAAGCRSGGSRAGPAIGLYGWLTLLDEGGNESMLCMLTTLSRVLKEVTSIASPEGDSFQPLMAELVPREAFFFPVKAIIILCTIAGILSLVLHTPWPPLQERRRTFSCRMGPRLKNRRWTSMA